MKFDTEYKVATKLIINGIEVDFIDTISMVGLETVASCMGSPFSFPLEWMPFIGVGYGVTEPSTEDKHLEYPIYRKRGSVSVSGTAYTVHALFDENEPPDAYILREVGIFDKLPGGRMGARWVTLEDYSIAAIDLVNVTCTIYIT